MADSRARAFTTTDFLEDFDYLWETFAAEYAYFDEKDTDWARVRQHYRRKVEATGEGVSIHLHLGADSRRIIR